MILIFGGAYQGKLDYAKERFGLSDDEIFFCTEQTTRIDFSKKAIANLEELSLACTKRGESARDYFAARREEWKDAVLLCADISAGVVPVDPVLRAWREENGRLLAWLCAASEETVRMFCGLPQRLK